MKTIEIQTEAFFDILKNRGISMWTVFEEMVNEEEEQLIIFFDEAGKEMAHYVLPKSKEQVQEDNKVFSESFKEKLKTELN